MRQTKKSMIATFTFLLFCFQSNSPLGIGIPNLYAQTLAPNLYDLAVTPDARLMEIPAELGKIEERFVGTSLKSENKRTIIYIQEAHANFDAAKNIQSLITHFQNKYNLPLVLLEGGEGKLDSLFFQSFPNEFIKENVVTEYLKRGELSGGEAASILGQSMGTEYFGIENDKYYVANKKAFLETETHKREGVTLINKIRHELTKNADRIFSQRSYEYWQARENFQSEQLDLLKYLKALKDLIPTGKAEELARVFPELFGLLEFDHFQRTYNREEISISMKHVIEIFKRNYLYTFSEAEQRQINLKIQEYHTGRIEYGDLVRMMNDLVKIYRIEWVLPAALKKGAEQSKTISSIQGTRLFDELKNLENLFAEILSGSEEEKNLLNDFENLSRLQRLFDLKLTRDDWRTFHDVEMTDLFSSAYVKNLTEQLKGAFQKNIEFYEYAVKRDQILFENIVHKIDEKKSKVTVVVTGGFHSEGISEKLRESGVSFVLVTPTIESLNTDETQYHRLMQGDMQYMKYYRGSRWDALARDYSATVGEKIDSSDLAPTMKRWRDQIVQNTIAESRITDAAKYTRYVDSLVYSIRKQFAASGIWKTDGINRAELREELDTQLDRFFPIYMNLLKDHVDSKLGLLKNNLENIWFEKKITKENVQTLLSGLTAPASTLALEIALIPDAQSANFSGRIVEIQALEPAAVQARVNQILSLPLSPIQILDALNTYEIILNAQNDAIGEGPTSLIRGVFENTTDVFAMIQTARDQLNRQTGKGALTIAPTTTAPLAPQMGSIGPRGPPTFTSGVSKEFDAHRTAFIQAVNVNDQWRMASELRIILKTLDEMKTGDNTPESSIQRGTIVGEIFAYLYRAIQSGNFSTTSETATAIKSLNTKCSSCSVVLTQSGHPRLAWLASIIESVLSQISDFIIPSTAVAPVAPAAPSVAPTPSTVAPATPTPAAPSPTRTPTPTPAPSSPASTSTLTRESLQNALDHAKDRLALSQEEYVKLEKSLRTDDQYQNELIAKEAELDLFQRRFIDAKTALTNFDLAAEPGARSRIEALLGKVGQSIGTRSPASALEAFADSSTVQDAYNRAMLFVRTTYANRLTQLLQRSDLDDNAIYIATLSKLGEDARQDLVTVLAGIDTEIANIVIPVVLMEVLLSHENPSQGTIEFLGASGTQVRNNTQADLFGRGRSTFIAALGLVLGTDISAPTGIGKTMASRLALAIAKSVKQDTRAGLFLENADSEGKFFKELNQGGQFEGMRQRTVGTDFNFATGVTDAEIGALLGYQLVRASEYIGDAKNNFAGLHTLLQSPKSVLVMDVMTGSQLGNQYDELSEDGRLDALDLYEFLQQEMDMKIIDEAQNPALQRIRSIISKGGNPNLKHRKQTIRRGLSAAAAIDALFQNKKFKILKKGDVESFLYQYGADEDAENPLPETPAVLITDEGVEMNRVVTKLLRKALRRYGFRTQQEFKSFLRALYGKESALKMATQKARLEQKPFDELKGIEKKQQSSDIALQLGNLYRFIQEHQDKPYRVDEIVQDLFREDLTPTEDNKDDDGHSLSGDTVIEGINLNPGWFHRWFLSWLFGSVQVDFGKLGKWFNFESIGRLDTKTGTPMQEIFSRGVRALSATLPLMNAIFTGNLIADLGTSRPDLRLYQQAGRLNLGMADLDNDADVDVIINQINAERAKVDAKGNSVNPVIVVPLSKYQGNLRERLDVLAQSMGLDIREVSATTTGADVQAIESERADQSFVIIGSSRIATGRDFKGTLSVFGVGIENYSADLLAQLIGRDRSNSGQIHLYASNEDFFTNLVQSTMGAESGDFTKFLKRQIALLEAELQDTLNRTDRSREAQQRVRLQEMRDVLALSETLQEKYQTRHSIDEMKQLFSQLTDNTSTQPLQDRSVTLTVRTGDLATDVQEKNFSAADFFTLNAQYRYMMTQSHASRFVVTTMVRNEILTKPLKKLKSRLLRQGLSPSSTELTYLDSLIKEIEEGKIFSIDTYLERRVQSGEEFVRNELQMQLDFVLGENIREEGILEKLEKNGLSRLKNEIDDIFQVTQLRELKRSLKNTNEFNLASVLAEVENNAHPERFSFSVAADRNLRDFFKAAVLMGDYVVTSHQSRAPSSAQAEAHYVQTAKVEENRGQLEEKIREATEDASLARRVTEYLTSRSKLRGRRVSQAALNLVAFLQQVKEQLNTDIDQSRHELNQLKDLINRRQTGKKITEDCSSTGGCMELAVAIAEEMGDQGLFLSEFNGGNAYNAIRNLLNLLPTQTTLTWESVVSALRSENQQANLNRQLVGAPGLSRAGQEAQQRSFKRESEQKRFKAISRAIGKSVEKYSSRVQRNLQNNPWFFINLQYYFPSPARILGALHSLNEKRAGLVHSLRLDGLKKFKKQFVQPFFGGSQTLGGIYEATSTSIDETLNLLRVHEDSQWSESDLNFLKRRWDILSSTLGRHFTYLSPEEAQRLIGALQQTEKGVGKNGFLQNQSAVVREAYRTAFNQEAESVFRKMLDRVGVVAKVGFTLGAYTTFVYGVSLLSLPVALVLIQVGILLFVLNSGLYQLSISKMKDGAYKRILSSLLPNTHTALGVWVNRLLYFPKNGIKKPLSERARRAERSRQFTDLMAQAKQARMNPTDLALLQAAKIRVIEEGCGSGGCGVLDQALQTLLPQYARVGRLPQASVFNFADIHPSLGSLANVLREIDQEILRKDARISGLTLGELRALAVRNGLNAEDVWDLAKQIDPEIARPSDKALAAIQALGINENNIHISELKELSKASFALANYNVNRGFLKGDLHHFLETFTLSHDSIAIIAQAAGLTDPTQNFFQNYYARNSSDLVNVRKIQAKEKIANAIRALKAGDRSTGAASLDTAYVLDSNLGKNIAEIELDFRLAGGIDYIYEALDKNIQRIQNDINANAGEYWSEESRGLQTQLDLMRARQTRPNAIIIDPTADSAAANRGGTITLSKTLMTSLNLLRRDPSLGSNPEEVIQAMIGIYLMHEETEGRLDVLNDKLIGAKIAELEAQVQAGTLAADDDHLVQLKEVYLLIRGQAYGEARGENPAGANDLGKAFRDYAANLYEMYLIRTLPSDQLEAVYYSFTRMAALWNQRGMLDKITQIRRFISEGKNANPIEKGLLQNGSGDLAKSSVAIFSDYFRYNQVFGYIFQFRDAVENGLPDRARAILERERGKNYDEQGRPLSEPNIGNHMIQMMEDLLSHIGEDDTTRKISVQQWWGRVEENALYLFSLYHDFTDPNNPDLTTGAASFDDRMQLHKNEHAAVRSELRDNTRALDFQNLNRLQPAEELGRIIAQVFLRSGTYKDDEEELIAFNLEKLFFSGFSVDEVLTAVRPVIENNIQKGAQNLWQTLELTGQRADALNLIESRLASFDPDELTTQLAISLFSETLGLVDVRIADTDNTALKNWKSNLQDLLKSALKGQQIDSDTTRQLEGITQQDLDWVRSVVTSLGEVKEKRVIEYQISDRLSKVADIEFLFEDLMQAVRSLSLFNLNFKIRIVVSDGQTEKQLRRIFGKNFDSKDLQILGSDHIMIMSDKENSRLTSILDVADVVISDNAVTLARRNENNRFALDSKNYDSASETDNERLKQGIVYSGKDRVTPTQLLLTAASALTEKAVEGLKTYDNGLMRAENQAVFNRMTLIAKTLMQEVLRSQQISRSA